ncbi:alpha/beta fold hydrolase [Culicoidibacter larvae]|nr:alpha/beta hydrolase [Culicoidibacter larvae]
MEILLGILIALVVIVLVILIAYQVWKWNNRRQVRLTGEKAVDYGEYVELNGIEQYFYHRGHDKNNPVMIFLHGGPGSPMLPFANAFQLEWEKQVTVVQWDQRGAGKTYFRNRDKKTPTITMEQMLADGKAMIDYLKTKYDKDKIIIMGHSWGSVLGSQLALKYPHDIIAYIGIGQVVNMFNNEQVGYDKVLEAAKKAGNSKDIQILESLLPYPTYEFDERMKKNIMRLRGVQAKYKLSTGVSFELVKLAFGSPFYSFHDATFFLQTKAASLMAPLFDDLLKFDLPTIGTEYQVPYFTIQGENDWQTPISLAREYFAEVQAPRKEFFAIENACHSPMLENKALNDKVVLRILSEINEKGKD